MSDDNAQRLGDPPGFHCAKKLLASEAKHAFCDNDKDPQRSGPEPTSLSWGPPNAGTDPRQRASAGRDTARDPASAVPLSDFILAFGTDAHIFFIKLVITSIPDTRPYGVLLSRLPPPRLPQIVLADQKDCSLKLAEYHLQIKFRGRSAVQLSWKTAPVGAWCPLRCVVTGVSRARWPCSRLWGPRL